MSTWVSDITQCHIVTHQLSSFAKYYPPFSQCLLCSQFTTWFKQLNLQLFKKQEYDSLLCHLSSMSLQDVHHTLKNDFHWDMAIREVCLQFQSVLKVVTNVTQIVTLRFHAVFTGPFDSQLDMRKSFLNTILKLSLINARFTYKNNTS